MNIRLAEVCDVPDILRLLRQVNHVHAAGRPDLFKDGGTKYTPEDLKDKLLRSGSEPIFVAEENGRVLGYAFLILEDVPETENLRAQKNVYLDDLCVDEAFRGQGIGKALFQRVRSFAEEGGYSRLTLRVWELNPGAVRFYEAMGMKVLYREMETLL